MRKHVVLGAAAGVLLSSILISGQGAPQAPAAADAPARVSPRSSASSPIPR
jgi:hypothetical protein